MNGNQISWDGMLKKANCRWYTAETEQTELCPERLLDAEMFFCIKKKISFRRYGGKKFPDGIPDGRSRRRYARFLH